MTVNLNTESFQISFGNTPSNFSMEVLAQKPKITRIKKEGWLEKQSSFWKTYRKRWMVLQGRQLFSFKDEKTYENPTEIFDLRVYKKVKVMPGGKTGQFELLSANDSRTLLASSDNEMKDWIKHIRHALAPPKTNKNNKSPTAKKKRASFNNTNNTNNKSTAKASVSKKTKANTNTSTNTNTKASKAKKSAKRNSGSKSSKTKASNKASKNSGTKTGAKSKNKKNSSTTKGKKKSVRPSRINANTTKAGRGDPRSRTPSPRFRSREEPSLSKKKKKSTKSTKNNRPKSPSKRQSKRTKPKHQNADQPRPHSSRASSRKKPSMKVTPSWMKPSNDDQLWTPPKKAVKHHQSSSSSSEFRSPIHNSTTVLTDEEMSVSHSESAQYELLSPVNLTPSYGPQSTHTKSRSTNDTNELSFSLAMLENEQQEPSAEPGMANEFYFVDFKRRPFGLTLNPFDEGAQEGAIVLTNHNIHGKLQNDETGQRNIVTHSRIIAINNDPCKKYKFRRIKELCRTSTLPTVIKFQMPDMRSSSSQSVIISGSTDSMLHHKSNSNRLFTPKAMNRSATHHKSHASGPALPMRAALSADPYGVEESREGFPNRNGSRRANTDRALSRQQNLSPVPAFGNSKSAHTQVDLEALIDARLARASHGHEADEAPVLDEANVLDDQAARDERSAFALMKNLNGMDLINKAKKYEKNKDWFNCVSCYDTGVQELEKSLVPLTAANILNHNQIQYCQRVIDGYCRKLIKLQRVHARVLAKRERITNPADRRRTSSATRRANAHKRARSSMPNKNKASSMLRIKSERRSNNNNLMAIQDDEEVDERLIRNNKPSKKAGSNSRKRNSLSSASNNKKRNSLSNKKKRPMSTRFADKNRPKNRESAVAIKRREMARMKREMETGKVERPESSDEEDNGSNNTNKKNTKTTDESAENPQSASDWLFGGGGADEDGAPKKSTKPSKKNNTTKKSKNNKNNKSSKNSKKNKKKNKKSKKSKKNNGGGNNNGSDDDDDEKESKISKQDQAFRDRLTADIIDEKPDISFKDVQGLANVKLALYETIILPALRPELFTGLRTPTSGLLLFGPPGNGKTMIAKCVAAQCDATFFSISASSITSKFVGDAERIMRALFALAREKSPSIVFIDEIDSLLTARGGKNEAESSRKIKTEFLIQFDGVQKASDAAKRILVIGATNLPDQLDEAVLRRFGKRILVPLPDEETRLGLLKFLMSKQKTLLTDKDFGKIVKASKGYSCSDLTTLCKDAAMGPIRSLGARILEIKDESDMPAIEYTHFQGSLGNVKPSLPEASLKYFLDWNDKFGSKIHLSLSSLPADMRPYTQAELDEVERVRAEKEAAMVAANEEKQRLREEEEADDDSDESEEESS